MPYLAAPVRAQGRPWADSAEPWPDHDWSIPTDAETLRHRVLPLADQSRYGTARDERSDR